MVYLAGIYPSPPPRRVRVLHQSCQVDHVMAASYGPPTERPGEEQREGAVTWIRRRRPPAESLGVDTTSSLLGVPASESALPFPTVPTAPCTWGWWRLGGGHRMDGRHRHVKDT